MKSAQHLFVVRFFYEKTRENEAGSRLLFAIQTWRNTTYFLE